MNDYSISETIPQIKQGLTKTKQKNPTVRFLFLITKICAPIRQIQRSQVAARAIPLQSLYDGPHYKQPPLDRKRRRERRNRRREKMPKFDPWSVFFKREWNRNWPFLVGFAVTGTVITKLSLGLTGTLPSDLLHLLFFSFAVPKSLILILAVH